MGEYERYYKKHSLKVDSIGTHNATQTKPKALDNTEKLLKDKMAEGWNIYIECKGKGREYEFTYEGTAHKVDAPIETRFYTANHSIGNTIEELLNNMFEKGEK